MTNVTAEDPLADLRTQFFKDFTLVLNCEIGDAEIRIECSVGQDGLGGTGIDAARAGAAMVAGEGLVDRQFDTK